MSPQLPAAHPSQLKIKDYDYDLPDSRIAKYPLEKRDASKLLIYKNEEIQADVYKNIDRYLQPSTLVVFNETKVVHARLIFKKTTGARIEVFCLEPDEQYESIITAMHQTKEVFWKCFVGGAAKWKSGQILELETEASSIQFKVYAQVVRRSGEIFYLKFRWKILNKASATVTHSVTFADILQAAGLLPLPPYLHRQAEKSDETRYQTIFARNEGSVAAPTAALHFTTDLLSRLEKQHIDFASLTLHVGAGTFKPVKTNTLKDHGMHAEWISVPGESISQVLNKIKNGEKIVATGTTSARSLESLYWIGVKILIEQWEESQTAPGISQWYPYEAHITDIPTVESLQAILNYLKENNKNNLITKTQIIIAPGYDFKVIDGLITNFHQPQSTLLLLIAALIGDNWRKVYNYALNNDFRFLSYGDGCLLWK